MGLCFALIALVVGGLVVHTVVSRERGRGRWGTEPGEPIAVGAGAYRSANVQTTRPREPPGWMLFASVTTRMWAAATLLVFAPAGVLGTVIVCSESRNDVAAALGALACITVVMLGFALAVALVRAAGRLDRREAGPLTRTLLWSYVHHVTVGGVCMAMASQIGHDALRFFGTTVTPICAIGLGITFLFACAVQRAEQPETT